MKNALEARDYRPLYHLLCVAIVFAAACFLFYRSFGHAGTLMATDMTWPDSFSRMQFKVVNTWTPYTGSPLTIDPLFLFWVYPSSMVARLLHVSTSRYMLSMFLGTFALGGVSMYALAFSTARKLKFKDAASYAPYVGAVVAALVYMYNPWSITYLKPYFAYPIYAFLPLVFMAMVKTFDHPSARNIILFSIFVAFVNTTYQLTWLWGLLVSYTIFSIAISRQRKEAARKSSKALLGTLVLYFLFNAHWIFPYLGSRISGKPYVAFYGPELSRTVVSGLSTNNYLANGFRLLSVWTWSIEKLKGGFFLQALSYAIPVFAVLGLVLAYRKIKRDRVVLYWALVSLLALLLTTGASFIIRRPYLYFTFSAPGSGVYGWLLRTSERWTFFVPLFFSLMIAILLLQLLEKYPTQAVGDRLPGGRWKYFFSSYTPGQNARSASAESNEDRLKNLEGKMALSKYYRNTALGVIISVLVITSMFPKALSSAQDEFKPVVVPGDYAKLKSYLSLLPGEPRVVWMPFIGPSSLTYSWSNNRPVDSFGPMNSSPNLYSTYEVMNANSYFNWLQNLYLASAIPDVALASKDVTLRKDILSRLLAPFSARYLVFDTSVQGYDFGGNLDTDTSLDHAYMTKLLRVFKLGADPGHIWCATRTVNANSFYDNLAFNQKLAEDELKNVAFTDGSSYHGDSAPVGPGYGGVYLNRYLEPVNWNPGFEIGGAGGQFPGWTWDPGSASAKISGDTKHKVGGKRSLRIENEATSNFSMCFVVSDTLPVQPESIYALESNIKFTNANWSFVSIQGFMASSGQWIDLAYCPTLKSGSSDWRKYYCSVYVPPGIKYIRTNLTGGWVKDPKLGPAVTWFDSMKMFKVKDAIYSQIASREAPPLITFRQISAEKYQVKVKGAKAPFVLVLGEEYDGKWVATTDDGKRSDSVPLYSTINGFTINKTGDFEVLLEYRPQVWFSWGLVVSLLALFLCLLYLLYDWKGRAVLRAPKAARGAACGGGSATGPPGRRRDSLAKTEGPALIGQKDSLFVRCLSPLRRAGSKLRRLLEEPPRRGAG